MSLKTPRRLRSAVMAGATALAVAATGVLIGLSAPGAAYAAVLPNGFKSVGYMPSWAGSATSIQYNKLTHINYAFALPNADGSLRPIENTAKLSQIVQLGHQNNTKVLLAVGGWNDGNDSAFETFAASSGGRTNFVNSMVNVVNQYGLDGVDIDWEYPDPGQSGNNYTALMQELGKAMHSRGKLLTAAVVSEGGTANGVQPAVFGSVDFLNIMAYDGGTPHANYDWAINAVNFWKGRGLPREKAILGVPFYSRPSFTPFNTLVAQDPANANRDCTPSGECYNGLPTIRRKTEWAKSNAGGIMNWELSQDASGGNSLVSAIFEVASGGNPPQQPGGQNQLRSGQRLSGGQGLTSSNGRFHLNMQTDGNLVIYDGSSAIWHTNTWEHPNKPTRAELQSDGNLVLYNNANQAAWASGSWGSGRVDPFLEMQDDGNLVIYHNGRSPLWASGTSR
jgi:chitinase